MATNTWADVSNSATSLNDSISKVTEDVIKVDNIVSDQKKYVSDVKTFVDGEYNTKKRIIELSDSYRKRVASGTQITIVIVIGLVIFIVLMLFKAYLPYPDTTLTIAGIIIFAIIGIYCVAKYIDMSGRDPTNYDRIKLPGPASKLTASQLASRTQKAQKAGDLLNVTGPVCVGQDCCDEGYILKDNKCYLGNVDTTNKTPTDSFVSGSLSGTIYLRN